MQDTKDAVVNATSSHDPINQTFSELDNVSWFPEWMNQLAHNPQAVDPVMCVFAALPLDRQERVKQQLERAIHKETINMTPDERDQLQKQTWSNPMIAEIVIKDHPSPRLPPDDHVFTFTNRESAIYAVYEFLSFHHFEKYEYVFNPDGVCGRKTDRQCGSYSLEDCKKELTIGKTWKIERPNSKNESLKWVSIQLNIKNLDTKIVLTPLSQSSIKLDLDNGIIYMTGNNRITGMHTFSVPV
jgi:hypothetical protein